jgi:hypothetical protein
MNQVSPFEFISILVSIILGLGIAQLLSAIADLLYHIKKLKTYWPHTIWVGFIFFLHIQDWFITYQLKTLQEWSLLQLSFVLMYPIMLFLIAKMLLPTNHTEELFNMKVFYDDQYRMIFILMAISVVFSIVFNVWLLQYSWAEQIILFVFLGTLIYLALQKKKNEHWHRWLAIAMLLGAITTTVIERNNWVIK